MDAMGDDTGKDDAVHGLEEDEGRLGAVVVAGLGADVEGIGDAGGGAVAAEADVGVLARGQGNDADEVPLVAAGGLVEHGGGQDLAVGDDVIDDVGVPAGRLGSGGPPGGDGVDVGPGQGGISAPRREAAVLVAGESQSW